MGMYFEVMGPPDVADLDGIVLFHRRIAEKVLEMMRNGPRSVSNLAYRTEIIVCCLRVPGLFVRWCCGGLIIEYLQL